MVTWFGESLDSLLELPLLKLFVTNLWSVVGGWFEDLCFWGCPNVQEGLRIIFLHLVRWTLKVGCLLKGGLVKDLWVRVLGLPFHLWSWEVFKKIGDYYGGFVAMEEDTACMSNLQWARILVKLVGRVCLGCCMW